MSREHNPRKGSRAYWPRKRAKRIYPRIQARAPGFGQAGPTGFAAYKAGMVSFQTVEARKGAQSQEVVRAATVLAAPPLVVSGIAAYDNRADGPRKRTEIWSGTQAKDLARKRSVPAKPADPKAKLADLEKHPPSSLRLLVHTKPREATGKKTPEVFEVPLGGTPEQQLAYAKERLGKELPISDVFKEGELIDVHAVDTGKGFQGVVKRFGVVIRSRKNKGKKRHVGSLGPQNPAHVIPAKLAMAGQMGYQTRTEWNKKVLKIANGKLAPAGGFLRFGEIDGTYVLLEGSVPGPRKRLIMLQKGTRTRGKIEPVEIKQVFLDSQQ